METSGHAALFENYFLDDGAYLTIRLLIAMVQVSKNGKTLSDLIADLDEPIETGEIRLSFHTDSDFRSCGKQVLSDLADYANGLYYASPAKDNYEGVRLCFDNLHGNGWMLARMSLHEPLLTLHFESESVDGAVKMVKDLYYFLRRYTSLDVTPLEDYAKAWRKEKVETLKIKFAR